MKISNFFSSVHNTFFQSSVVNWRCLMAQASLVYLVWHLSNGFLAATWLIKPATRSLLFTDETEICLLRPLLRCAWNCCPVSLLSRKLLTFRDLSSDSVVALSLPDLFLSEFFQFSECLLMGKETVLTDTLTFFVISLLSVMIVCLSSFANCIYLAIFIAMQYFMLYNTVKIMLTRV